MQKKTRTRKPSFSGAEHKQIWYVTREVIDSHRDEVIGSDEIAKKAMKKLALPTSNPIAVWMMEQTAIQIAGAVLRHYFDVDDQTNTAQRNFGNEFSPRIQDAYGLVRNGKCVHVPRNQMTQTEYLWVIKKLKTIGAGYYDHATALQKEMETRFSKEAAS